MMAEMRISGDEPTYMEYEFSSFYGKKKYLRWKSTNCGTVINSYLNKILIHSYMNRTSFIRSSEEILYIDICQDGLYLQTKGFCLKILGWEDF